MDSKDVVSYIEGEPFINTVPIETGLTNTVISTVAGKNKSKWMVYKKIGRYAVECWHYHMLPCRKKKS